MNKSGQLSTSSSTSYKINQYFDTSCNPCGMLLTIFIDNPGTDKFLILKLGTLCGAECSPLLQP